MALPALLVAVTGLVVLRRNRLEKNVALARRQKAPRAARLNIQRAEQAIRHRDAAAFYEALWNAIAEYFGHRLNLAPGQVTLQSVLARIPGESGTVEQLFNTVEQRRYGIRGETDDPQEMKLLLRQLVGVLKKCERMKL
jgi:DNA-binding response OmpR family regulator